VLLEALGRDRGGQHAGPDSRLGGVFVVHAARATRSVALGFSGSRSPAADRIRTTPAGDLMPDDRAARLAELHRLRRGDILYPGNSGCAGARGGSGAPGPCQGEVTAAAMKHYRGPERPHRTGSSSATSTPPSRPPNPSPTPTEPSSRAGGQRPRTGRRYRRGSAPRTAWSADSASEMLL
jgi:hypothetical protein